MIVIPMAGLSSRFFKEGYSTPKYQLPLGEETVFSWAISSFKKYFDTDLFVFIYRDLFNTKQFIEKEIKNLGIRDYLLIELNEETKGQADTVYLGIKDQPDSELFVFNIDSKLHSFSKPAWYKECDGYLEVFKGEGDHWSFAEPASDSNSVIKTTEKERISDLCSNGLYYFKSSIDFCDLVDLSLQNNDFVKGELYIAPLYNQMIQKGADIRYEEVEAEDIEFCGIPSEYKSILEKMGK